MRIRHRSLGLLGFARSAGPCWATPLGDFHVYQMLRDPSWEHPLTRKVFAPGATGNQLGHVIVFNDVIAFYPARIREALSTFAQEHGVDWLALARAAEKHRVAKQRKRWWASGK